MIISDFFTTKTIQGTQQTNVCDRCQRFFQYITATNAKLLVYRKINEIIKLKYTLNFITFSGSS